MAEQLFVARDDQLARLRGYLDRSLAGQGHLCFVSGVAGSGKTALLAEFARQAEETNEQLVVAMGNCNAQTGIGDPYLPFREILALLTGDVEERITHGAITPQSAERLRALLSISGQLLVELAPDLIGLFVPGGKLAARAAAYVAKKVGWLDKLEQIRKRESAGGVAPSQEHIFEQYTQLLSALAARRPLMLVLDDLQWVDDASATLLFHLARRLGQHAILLVGCYRPDEVALGRGGQPHPLQKVLSECKRYLGDVLVDLDDIAPAEAQQFVDAYVDSEPNRLGYDFRQSLLAHTRGYPLFTVELLREMRERGDLVQDERGLWAEGPSLHWEELPPRVEGVIEGRIGRLAQALRETLTVASVEGEDFTAEVVARVRAVDERAMVRQLSGELDRQHRLVGATGMRRLPSGRLSLYRFRHNLFQRYLYGSLDAAERAYLHEDVGNVLEAIYGEQANEEAVQLAHHFEEAGATEKAICYLQQAAERAMRMSANAEAIGHLSRGLALLQGLPATAMRDRMELPLQMGLGTAMIIAQGWAAPGVQAALDRARALCHGAEGAPQLFPVLRGLYVHYHARAEHRVAYELAQQLFALAQETRDPASLLMAHDALGQSQVEMGHVVTARDMLRHGLAYHDPEQYRSLAYFYSEEHGVSSRFHLAFALYLLGYLDQCLVAAREALALAEALGHPHILAYSLYGMSTVHVFRHESQAVIVYAERALHLCDKMGIPFWRAAVGINHGHALAMQGRAREGIAEAQQALSAYRAIGARVLQTAYLAQLADMHLMAGQADAGLVVADEGLAAVSETEERLMEAELYRLRGEFLRLQGRESDAEAYLRRAIEIALAQQTRFWELRAAMALCRLWLQQGRRDEARTLLAPLYGWFTEGLDIADLRDARTLLQELSPG